MNSGCLVAFLSVAAVAMGQSRPTVVSVGYGPFQPIVVAPGQIVTLFASSIGESIDKPVVADTVEGTLPTSLGGISVRLLQTDPPILLPILEVRPVSTCPVYSFLGRDCGRILAITAQIPMEIAEDIPASARPPLVTQLAISEGSIMGPLVDVRPVEAQVRILRICDLESTRSFGGNCGVPVITHADGRLVTSTDPAAAGESVIAFSLGLGRTDPSVPTGKRAPASLVKARFHQMSYQFGNAGMSAGAIVTRVALEPDFVGLTPGAIGVYQVNFRVPSVPDGTPPCSIPGRVGSGGNFIDSNLTIIFKGSLASDIAGLCIRID